MPGLLPPSNLSSSSTVPHSRSRSGRTIARRSLCSHAHAVSYEPNPRTRCRPCAEIPFFCEVTNQIAANHVDNGVRERWKIVPAVAEVFRRTRCTSTGRHRSARPLTHPHRGQMNPFSHRSFPRYSRHVISSGNQTATAGRSGVVQPTNRTPSRPTLVQTTALKQICRSHLPEFRCIALPGPRQGSVRHGPVLPKQGKGVHGEHAGEGSDERTGGGRGLGGCSPPPWVGGRSAADIRAALRRLGLEVTTRPRLGEGRQRVAQYRAVQMRPGGVTDGVLNDPVEEHPATAGLTPVESKVGLAQVAVRVHAPGGARYARYARWYMSSPARRWS